MTELPILSAPASLSHDDMIRLSRDLGRLVTRYRRKGFGQYEIHSSITQMTVGWLITNGLPTDTIHEIVDAMEKHVAEAQAESTQLQ